MLSKIWIGMMAVALIVGAANGKIADVSTAALTGAGDAVQLVLTIAGPLMLWSGVSELMRTGGVTGALARLLGKPLSAILGRKGKEAETGENICANVSANLLGLGNAATPPGLAAAGSLGELGERKALSRFIILNTASLQLIPTTIASIRAGYGAEQPFDICPAVWVTSAGALTVALGSAALIGKLQR